MEVHHHPQIEKKRFKEYFFEFIMIFLAVSLGFFAESYREHLRENKKEKEFVASLKEDLATDTAQLNSMVVYGRLQYEKLDSLYILLRLSTRQKPVNMNQLYYLNFEYGFGLNYFHPNKRTISQIKSTGSFSLIANKDCRDSITLYDNFNEDVIKTNSAAYEDWLNDLNKMSQKIFNYDEVKTFGFLGSADVYTNDSLKVELVAHDPLVLTEYANKVRSLMMILDILIRTEQLQLTRCTGLLDLLNREYRRK